ncbi:MAG: hypothetical protein MPW15_18780 [Candidatus Manganitrophus sp.]|nr:hypothetical protein [Candidatus Manganitrophus sp.]
MKPVVPWTKISLTEPQGRAITGVPQASDSIMTKPNGSGQSIGKRSANASPRKSFFSLSPISPINSIRGGLIKGRITGVEIIAILVADLGRDLQRNADLLSDGDGEIGSFFRGNPSEKSKVISRFRIEAELVHRQTMMNSIDPICEWKGGPLAIADGDQRVRLEVTVNSLEVRAYPIARVRS